MSTSKAKLPERGERTSTNRQVTANRKMGEMMNHKVAKTGAAKEKHNKTAKYR